MTKQWANELASRILLGLTPTHPDLWRSHIVSVLTAPNAHEPLEQRPGTILKAFDVIRETMRDDPEYAWSWHCNIAMPIMDTAKVSHELANKAAAHLMQHLFAIDTRDNQHYQYRSAVKSQCASQAINSIDDVAAICHSVTGLCCHILGSPGGPCTIGNCAAVRGYLGGPEFARGVEQPVATPGAAKSEDAVIITAVSSGPRGLLSQGASRDASSEPKCGLCGKPGITEFVRTCCAEGRARDLATARTASRASPADLVGALQDVVHTDPGPVRAGKAVRDASSEEK